MIEKLDNVRNYIEHNFDLQDCMLLGIVGFFLMLFAVACWLF